MAGRSLDATGVNALRLIAAIGGDEAAAETAAYLEVTLPEPLAADIECDLERSTDLLAWTAISARRGAGEWTGLAPFASVLGADDTRVDSFAGELDGGRVFYRLRFVLRGFVEP